MNGAKAGLGVVVSSRGLEAALDLPNAEGVSLCLYDGDREVFKRCDAARRRAASSAVLRLASAQARATASGSRAPSIRVAGPRFDASKLLADPYAWAFDRPLRLHPSMFAFGDDSGPFAPKAIARRADGRRARPQARRLRMRSSYMSSICAAFRG